MLTQEAVLTAVRNKTVTATLDGRDFSRLAEFFPASDLLVFGFELKEGMAWETKPWLEAEIEAQLASDLAFAFEKALNKRGISAGLMRFVIKMWLWVLEDTAYPEYSDDCYAQYGLPLLKAVAVKRGLPNPIGDDRGDEWKYSADTDR